jgi:hypothetical protein
MADHRNTGSQNNSASPYFSRAIGAPNLKAAIPGDLAALSSPVCKNIPIPISPKSLP